MSDFFVGTIMGAMIGFWLCLGIVIFMSEPTISEKLTSCAKTHNVYQCEMVAVPKTGEK